MTAPQRIDLRELTPQPWKNGAGLTREIAFGGASALRFDWRISLAEVGRDAPFSAFPGIDRCIALLHGGGMLLRSPDGALDHPLTEPLVPFRFSGDVAVDATLVDGPSSDFNVMTRRGEFRSEVTCHHAASALRSGEVTLVLCCAGRWQIGNQPEPLVSMQALLWREPTAAIGAEPLDEASALLLVRLCHDRQP